MKKFELVEKPSSKANNLPASIVSPTEWLFFADDEEVCRSINSHIDYMLENEITEMDLYLAKRQKNSDFFFCELFQEVSIKGSCGRFCKGYEPRNGKSGICKHYGYTYERTGRCFKLTVKSK